MQNIINKDNLSKDDQIEALTDLVNIYEALHASIEAAILAIPTMPKEASAQSLGLMLRSVSDKANQAIEYVQQRYEGDGEQQTTTYTINPRVVRFRKDIDITTDLRQGA